jgi:catechol 2,3-dioxygenase-like lactoylglutathione lyase family enzyme
MNYAMDHIVLNVENEEEMIVFYSEILMMPAERLGDYRAGAAPFPSVRLNRDTIIDLFPKRMWQQNDGGRHGRNLNHFCIVLEKAPWEALLARLQRLGIVIEEGPVPRWGAHGTGTSFYVRDPDRNLIEARFYASAPRPEKCLLGS